MRVPAAMVTLDGLIVTFELSVLPKVIVTPPTGAAVARVTANEADWFGPTVTLDCNTICPIFWTLTFAEPGI